MQVTNVIEIDKKRSKVFVDFTYAFALYNSEIKKYKIVCGEMIAEDIFRELNEQILPKRAKQRAMHLLTKKSYTEMKLRKKLEEGFYSAYHIEQAIAYVKSFGYIDDTMYARDYYAYHKEQKSNKMIYQKLLEKGIDREIIETILKEDANACKNREEEQIRQLLQKKYNNVVPQERKEKIKMFQFFFRKGFSAESVKQVLRHANLDDIYE